jgi:hypothetical protein
MKRLFALLLLVPFLLAAALQGVQAQSSDARLVGSWHGQAGDEKILVTFNADGTVIMGDGHGSDPGTYTADFSTKPGKLTLIPEKGEDKTPGLSYIEFVDDNHVRISQPSKQLPPSMEEGNAVVFERTAK